MANFRAHVYGASAVSSIAALGVHSLGWAGPQQTQLLFLLGVTGGLLPDIDSDNSTPVRGFFTLLGVVLAFLMSFTFVGTLPIVGLAAVWALVFFTVRFGIYEIFARFTVHRGVWHSWLAVIFAGLATANLAHHLAGMTPWDSWLAGSFLALGYLSHLCLDEIAAVDLLGNRVRRSFGTALKPFSLNYPRASLAMLVAVIALVLAAPTPEHLLAAGERYGFNAQALQVRVIGDGDWLMALRGFFN
jgi:hypothetical protein